MSVPTVTGIAPNIGPDAGGQAVVITGTNFDVSQLAVRIGNTDVTSYTRINSTTINAVTPAHTASVNQSVYVQNADGNAGFAFLYTFLSPPTFVSAATNGDGTIIGVTFSRAMADPSGKHAQFKYQINGGADQAFSSAYNPGGGSIIYLVCFGTAIVYGNTITVKYTAGTVTAADGGILATFTPQSVTNNMPAPPTVSSAATNSSGTSIAITFNKVMGDPSGKHAQFKYQVNGGADQSFSSADYAGGGSVIYLACSGTAILYGDTVTAKYTKGTVVASDGAPLASFTGRSVTNDVVLLNADQIFIMM